MIKTKEIADYGPCSIQRFTYSADISATGKRLVSFEILDDECEQVESFPSFQRAKKFIHRFIADPEKATSRQRQLSADPIVHNRALWAVSVLSSYSEYNLTVTDRRKPQATPEQYEAIALSVNLPENLITVVYIAELENDPIKYLRFGGIKSVQIVGKDAFRFEVYLGKIYTICGKD